MILIEILLKKQDDEFMNFTDWETFQVRPFTKIVWLTHKSYPGKVVVGKNPDHNRLFFANINCEEEPGKEWQIMHAFIGRLADRSKDNLESIHLLFQ